MATIQTANSLRNRPLLRMLRNWRERHQHPANFAIHLLGIPIAVAGLVMLFVLPLESWYIGAGLLILGYVLQYLGHCIEGNDLGEWAGIKRLLGWPYVGIAPQYQKAPTLAFPSAHFSAAAEEAKVTRRVG